MEIYLSYIHREKCKNMHIKTYNWVFKKTVYFYEATLIILGMITSTAGSKGSRREIAGKIFSVI